MISVSDFIKITYAAVPAGTVDVSPWRNENFKGLVEFGITALFVVGGIAFVILFLIGALRYITSGGDVKSVDAAKKNITAALVGIVIMATTYSVAWFLNQSLGVPTFGGIISWQGSGGSPGVPGNPPAGICGADACPYDGTSFDNKCVTPVFGCNLISNERQRAICYRLSKISAGWNGNAHRWISNACQNTGENKPVNLWVGDWGSYCSQNNLCDCGRCDP
jgi:hypothetical protein